MYALKIIGIVLISSFFLSACIMNKKSIQEEINESANKNGFNYNIYETFDTIPNYQAVSPSLFEEIKNHKKTVVIDVRTPEEIAEGKISETAVEIDFYSKDFESKIQQLNKNIPYAIYCRSGSRSKKTLEIFKKNDFKEVYHLYGGINAWKKFKNQ